MTVVPDRLLIPVGLIIGTIVLVPIFTYFWIWKKLDPAEYREKFETPEAEIRIEEFDDHIL